MSETEGSGTTGPAVRKPEAFSDREWAEKIQRAKEARAEFKFARRGKPPTLPTNRVPR